MTAILMTLIFADSRVNTKPAATVTYVENWRADRSDAEIIAQQKKDQAAREAALKARQEQYKKLQDGLGIE
jgi:hypothetical protein